MIEYIAETKPEKASWMLFVFALQEIVDEILRVKYEPSTEEVESMRELLASHLEVMYGKQRDS